MALPRSESGFVRAIADIDTQVEGINAEITQVETELESASTAQEDDLYSRKADLEVTKATLEGDRQILETKFEEFKAKAASTEDSGSTEGKETTSKPAPTKEETSPAAEKKEYPHTAGIKVLKGGFMVNPYTGDRFTDGSWKDAILDGWIISQVEAGIMAYK